MKKQQLLNCDDLTVFRVRSSFPHEIEDELTELGYKILRVKVTSHKKNNTQYRGRTT